MINLLTNVILYSTEGSEISISAIQIDKHINVYGLDLIGLVAPRRKEQCLHLSSRLIYTICRLLKCILVVYANVIEHFRVF